MCRLARLKSRSSFDHSLASFQVHWRMSAWPPSPQALDDQVVRIGERPQAGFARPITTVVASTAAPIR
jgi:hypothetical protein